MNRIHDEIELENNNYDLEEDSCNLVYGELGSIFFYLRFLLIFSFMYGFLFFVSYIAIYLEITDEIEYPGRTVNILRVLIHIGILFIALTSISIIYIIPLYMVFVFLNTTVLVGSLSFLYSNLFFIEDNKIFRSRLNIDDLTFRIEDVEEITNLEVNDNRVKIVTKSNNYNIDIKELDDIHGELYHI